MCAEPSGTPPPTPLGASAGGDASGKGGDGGDGSGNGGDGPPSSGSSGPPKPVREGAPPGLRRPAGPGGAEGERGRDRAGEHQEGRGDRQPTPVREAFEKERDLPPDPPAPRKELTAADGRVWVVELVGRGRAGHRDDEGAPLVLLRFTPVSDRDERGASSETTLEALAVARELEEIPEDRLRELLEEAQPPDFDPSELFPGTRRKGRPD